MSRIAWTRMSPSEVFDALKAAPKVAGPWKGGARHDFAGRTVVFEYGGAHCYWIPELDPQYVNVSGRLAADARLRELGWLLVDDEPGTARTGSGT